MVGHFLAEFVYRFGLIGVALGAALEGEAAVLMGGGAAGNGLFGPIQCAMAASVGSFAADQAVFWVSRRQRTRPCVRERLDRPAVVRAFRFLEGHPRLFCLGFRFVYGFRIAGPAAVGISSVPGATFILLNAFSALLWGALFTFIGFRFGADVLHAMRPLLHLPHLAVELLIFVVSAVAVAAWARRR